MSGKINKERLKEIGKLASDIVASWTMDTLTNYAERQVVHYLSSLSRKEFEKKWDKYYHCGRAKGVQNGN